MFTRYLISWVLDKKGYKRQLYKHFIATKFLELVINNHFEIIYNHDFEPTTDKY